MISNNSNYCNCELDQMQPEAFSPNYNFDLFAKIAQKEEFNQEFYPQQMNISVFPVMHQKPYQREERIHFVSEYYPNIW